MQALLALLTFIFSIFAWRANGDIWWLVGGLVMVAVVPLTLLVIMPTVKALLDASLDKRSATAQALLGTWGRLHAVRTALSLVSLLLFLLLLVVKPWSA
jgi:uncharacterized membrane protein